MSSWNKLSKTFVYRARIYLNFTRIIYWSLYKIEIIFCFTDKRVGTDSLDNIDYHDLIGQYGSHNLLYLIDLTKRNVFHGFVLPAGNTTAWNQKEIAFTDAISHHNNTP